MGWIMLVAATAVAVGVIGCVVGLRDGRGNNDQIVGLVPWIVLALAGVALLVAAQIA